ncbi:hypothetical protein QJS10_CPA08g00075 [Acorus calamus]|uniref:Plant disease resistance WDH domain-containing protein n=1 Tax=Acorus calamus TaxID=4465 RepID=A0AAV9ECS4_ACOCL|nr:hypothetical protein QJS10_CPA08g00075 [Acorus calamus]
MALLIRPHQTLSGAISGDGSSSDSPEDTHHRVSFTGSLDSLSKLRSCDVYIGVVSGSAAAAADHVIRLANWVRAELELHGVSCFVCDRGLCLDVRARAMAERAMKSATFGLVFVTRRSFSSRFGVEEIRFFLNKKNLVPVFCGLRQEECLARDIYEKRGRLWGGTEGGELWRTYGGIEREWREAVEGLSRVELKVEVNAGNWRDCVSEAVVLLATRLGRRSSVEKAREAEVEEIPFPRNSGFVGRKRELLEIELMLFGEMEGVSGGECFELDTGVHRSRQAVKEGKGKEIVVWKESEEEIEVERPHRGRGRRRQSRRQSRVGATHSYGKGVACVSGEAGIGKTELVLEFVHRFFKRYKKVFWIGGEAKFFCRNYVGLLPALGVEAGAVEGDALSRSFGEMEEEAVKRVRKELMRDIPYLIVIDNVECEKDWWNGRSLMDLLPRFGGETHLIVTTCLTSALNLEPLRLHYLSAAEAMDLMRGRLESLPLEEVQAMRVIEEKLGRLTIGLAFVGAVLSEVAISPHKLLELVDRVPYKEPMRSDKEGILRCNPFMEQLLDFCFMTLGGGEENLAMRMTKASAYFAPSPIPISLLVSSAFDVSEEEKKTHIWKSFKRSLSNAFMASGARRSVSEALDMLIKFKIARTCSQDGYVQFHDIIRSYARKRGKNDIASSVVHAIRTHGSLPEHSDHVWAACLLLFKFGTDQPVIDLKASHLLMFSRRLVLPLATRAFTAFSMCRASLELLRLCTDALEAVEETLLPGEDNKQNSASCSCWRASSAQSKTRFDPTLYEEFALLRASFLEMRTKLMLKGEQYDIGEELCRTAISIREVHYGWEHPETKVMRELMEKLVRFQVR